MARAMLRSWFILDVSQKTSLAPAASLSRIDGMKTFTAVVERDPTTGLLVGYVPGLAGAHTQAKTLDELKANLQEVVELVLESGEPQLESEFIGTQTIQIA